MGDLTPLYETWQRQKAVHEIELPRQLDDLFWSTLGTFALHCASKPRRQLLAWTLNFQDPLVNIFLGGDTTLGAVAGRIFTDHVATAPYNSFFQEVSDRGKPVYRSFVEFEGHDPLLAAETFYQTSEQRPARFFQRSKTGFAVMSAHPDYDEEWFWKVDQQELDADLEDREHLQPIEKRPIRWECGCHQRRILETLGPIFQSQPEEVFADDDVITVSCPRCAGRYRITRETMEAFVAEFADQ